MAFAPVNVTVGEAAFWQTVAVPEIVAVGKGLTVTIALPGCNWLHPLATDTLTKL